MRRVYCLRSRNFSICTSYGREDHSEGCGRMGCLNFASADALDVMAGWRFDSAVGRIIGFNWIFCGKLSLSRKCRNGTKEQWPAMDFISRFCHDSGSGVVVANPVPAGIDCIGGRKWLFLEQTW